MKTKNKKQDKINIITLGCSKNIVDSEVLTIKKEFLIPPTSSN